jgi:hypothetical protein
LKPTPTDASVYLKRAVYAAAIHAANPYESSPAAIAAAHWPGDSVTPVILKATSAPATTTDSAWASSLAQAVVGDFIASLAPISAAAGVLNAAMRVSLAGVASISFPQRSGAITAAPVAWVAEGAPIPAAQLTTSRNVTLGPACKLAILTVMTRELLEHGSGQTVLSTMLAENVSAALDTTLFGNAAATTTQPAGLLNGVTALTPATAGVDAMNTDLTALAAAISTVTTGLAYVCNPKQAAAINIRRVAPLPAPVWPTIWVPAGTVIALDPLALVSAFGAAPEITTTNEGLIHMETSPAQIGVAGTPNVVAAPTRSMFQQDLVAVRLILRAAWAWRVPGAISYMSAVTW